MMKAAKTGMLIRMPIAEVFNAFIDPKITTRIWFTHSTGKLEAGKELEWTWAMYNIINMGFHGNEDELITQISDSTKGFSFLLASLKALLEHGIELNLVADAFPRGKGGA